MTEREPAARLRSVERRLRRDKLALERINPLERAEAYAAGLERVLDLESGRRALRALVADHPDAVALGDELGDEDDEDDGDDGDDGDVQAHDAGS